MKFADLEDPQIKEDAIERLTRRISESYNRFREENERKAAVVRAHMADVEATRAEFQRNRKRRLLGLS